MSQANVLVQKAVAAYKAGRKDEARDLLLQAVDQDETNEQAWLLLSGLVDSPEEQEICLENVLTINPNNEKARQRRDALKRTPPAPPAAPGFSFGTPDAGANAPAAGSNAPASTENPFGDWLSPQSSAPAPDPFGSVSSVDWTGSGPATYGSGKQVDLPSGQEYDEWVQGLNLEGGQPAAPEPSSFFSATSSPFSDTSFMVDSGPFGPDNHTNDQPAKAFGDDLFGSSKAGFAWDSDSPGFEEETPAPQASPSSFESASSLFNNGPFGSSSDFGRGELGIEEDLEEDNAFGSPFALGDSTTADEPEVDFIFDEDEEEEPGLGDSWLTNRLGASETAAPAGAPVFAGQPAGAGASAKDYFRYIPNDIEAKTSGFDRGGLILVGGIVLLAVLNIGSFGYLIMSLLG